MNAEGTLARAETRAMGSANTCLFWLHCLSRVCMPSGNLHKLSARSREARPQKNQEGGSKPALTISALEPYTICEMGKGSSVLTQQV